MKIEYYSNNSGGGDWLDDDQWTALKNEGWEISGFDGPWTAGEGRAKYARKEFPTLKLAIAEWEYLTGERSSALGCSCCGPPHEFTAYDDNGNWVDSYSPSYPAYGDDY